MNQILPASALDAVFRGSAASLIVEAFAAFYDTVAVDPATLRAVLAEELVEISTELEHTKVLMSATDGPIGIMAAYPAEEMSGRQRAGMFHLLSALDRDDVDRLISASAAHAKSVSLIPADSYYLARLAVNDRHRGTGAASILLGCLRDAAAGRKLSLHVHAKNARAIAFYRREGFEILPGDGREYLCFVGT